jgi:site-specific recombinase XerD
VHPTYPAWPRWSATDALPLDQRVTLSITCQLAHPVPTPGTPARLVVGQPTATNYAPLALKATRNAPEASDRIIHSERDAGLSPGAVQVWFHRLYATSLGFEGASSHSGRRTFVTNCAKKIIGVGGSLRDVQEMAGHVSLATTQKYIQGDTDAKRRVVDL